MSVAPESGAGHARGVRAAIMFGDDFDVLMMVASVQFVLDAEVREVDRLIEVRQVVFARPAVNLVRVAIRSSVAVGPAAIVLLQPFLILALELLLENNPMDLRALLAQAFLLAQIGAIELNVMRQLTRPAHVLVEGLLASIVTIPAVGSQEVVTASGEGHRALAPVQRHEPH